MALYLQSSGDTKFKQEKKRINDTLENVAEEMLNGIFCHYEPPDPRQSENYRRRGILRGGSNNIKKKKANALHRKSVSWSDVIDDNKPPVEIRCNVTTHCVDAGVEAGCVGNNKKTTTADALVQGHEHVVTNSESFDTRIRRPGQSVKDVVFDDNGYLRRDNVGSILSPPPPPPPPSRKEKFIPQLCGVQINCLEDNEQLERLAKESDYGRQPAEMVVDHYSDDDDNSIVDSNNESETLEDDSIENSKLEEGIKRLSTKDDDLNSSPRDDSRRRYSPKNKHGRNILQVTNKKLKKKSVKKQTGRYNQEPDWEATSNVSSIFHRILPSRKNNGKMSPSKRLSEPPKKVKQVTDLDPVEIVRVDHPLDRNLSPKVVIYNHLKHPTKELTTSRTEPTSKTTIGSRAKSPVKSAAYFNAVSPRVVVNNSLRQNVSSVEEDWDESVPIVRVVPPDGAGKSPRSRWSLPGRGRIREKRDASPGPIRRTRSRSADNKNKEENRRAFNPSALLRSKTSGRSKSPLRRHSSNVQPQHRSNDNVHYNNEGGNYNGEEFDKKSHITSYREAADRSIQNSSNISYYNPMERKQYQEIAPNDQTLIQTNDSRTKDDLLERQSYVTAHREGFENQSHKAVASIGSDDEDDRSSLITAHRDRFDKLCQPVNQPSLGRAGSPKASESISNNLQLSNEVTKPAPLTTKTNTSDVEEKTNAPLIQKDNTSIPPIQLFYQTLGFQQPSSPKVDDNPNHSSHQGTLKEEVIKPAIEIQEKSEDKGISSIAQPEEKTVENKAEEESTWEEKTRLAWERIRGGVTSFMSDTSSEIAKEDSKPEMDGINSPDRLNQNLNQILPDTTPSSPQSSTASNRSTVKPVGILRTPSSERRVRFGQDSEHIFHDDVNENDPTHVPIKIPLKRDKTPPKNNIATSPPKAKQQSPITPFNAVNKIVPNVNNTNSGTPPKKKKVLRGSRIISGFFGKTKPKSPVSKAKPLVNSAMSVTSVASSGSNLSKDSTVDSQESLLQQQQLYQQQLWNYYQQQQQQQWQQQLQRQHGPATPFQDGSSFPDIVPPSIAVAPLSQQQQQQQQQQNYTMHPQGLKQMSLQQTGNIPKSLPPQHQFPYTPALLPYFSSPSVFTAPPGYSPVQTMPQPFHYSPSPTIPNGNAHGSPSPQIYPPPLFYPHSPVQHYQQPMDFVNNSQPYLLRENYNPMIGGFSHNNTNKINNNDNNNNFNNGTAGAGSSVDNNVGCLDRCVI